MEITDLFAVSPTEEIQVGFATLYPLVHEVGGVRPPYNKIMVSVSGGADSDIVIDMIEKCGYEKGLVNYVFFDTGLEYLATKTHLTELERKYNINIDKYHAKCPVPMAVKKKGYPFISKQVSQFIYRLQKHDFKWEDKSFEQLYKEYPNCKAALRWWCDEFGVKSKMNISWRKGLKEFLVTNPPEIPISDSCCTLAKKNTAKAVAKLVDPDLVITGIRKSEGGVRSTAYTSCFSEKMFEADEYRPVFWFNKSDKIAYEDTFGVTHSCCYSTYGLDRTGCSCCPYGKYWQRELAAAEKYEPKLAVAAKNVFGPVYDYTRRYYDFIGRG